MTRREARESAFVLLFEWTFREDETVDEILEMARHCRAVKVDAFAEKLAKKTVERAIWLDNEIATYSDKWKVGRLSRVTLTVLRMSICELTQMEDIPAGATINEAVELMKKYATEDEAAYVNGVLGAYHRSNPGAEPVEAGDEPAQGEDNPAEADKPPEEAEPVADAATADRPEDETGAAAAPQDGE